MSVEAVASIRIDRSREEVARFLEDPGNDPAWIGGLTEVQVLTPPPFGPGTRVSRVAGFMGKRIEYVLEVKEYEPGARLEMKSVKGPFPMEVTYLLRDADGGTHVEIRNVGVASGFFKLASPLLSGMVRKNVQADLERLKAVLEA